jgi:histidinol-phosphate aminotransferase
MQLPLRHAVVDGPEYPFQPVEAPIKLDQNESAEDLPEPLKALVLQRLARAPWNRYPDLHSETLCAAIARHHEWSAPGVVVTTGSNVLISLLIQLAALDRRVVTVTPNFALYGLDAKLLGASLTEVPLREDFTLDSDALVATLQSGAPKPDQRGGVVYLPQPHAPTGSSMALSELERIATSANDWLVVIDEAYHQFAGTDATGLARRLPNVVLLRTFSKA